MENKFKDQIRTAYLECVDENERAETIVTMAELYDITPMHVRQVLQDQKVYKVKEGKTEKEQYAEALWAITQIDRKEWMKLTLKAQKKLMEIFRNG